MQIITSVQKSRKRKIRSIKSRIMIAITVVVLFVSVSQFVMSITKYTRSSKQLIFAQLKTSADNCASITNGVFSSYKPVMTVLSSQLADYNSYNEQELSAFLNNRLLPSLHSDENVLGVGLIITPEENFPDGYSYYLYKNNGAFVEDFSPNLSEDAGQDYYEEPLKTKKMTLSEPYLYEFSDGTSAPMVTISMPVIKDNNVLCVIIADISLTALKKTHVEVDSLPSLDVSIISSEGTYVYDSKDSKLELTPCDSGDSEAIKKLLSGGYYIDDKIVRSGGNYSGTAVCYSLIPINGVDKKWIVAVSVDSSDFTAITKGLQNVLFFSAIAALVLVLAAVYILMRRYLKPINDIVSAAEDISRGHIDINLAPKRNDEISLIMNAFNDTSHKLKEYISDIDEKLEELSNGNLTVEIEKDYIGDFSAIKQSLVNISSSLNTTIGDIHATSQQVSSEAEQMATVAQDISSGSTQQAVAVEQLARSIDIMASQIKKNTNDAVNASELSKQTAAEADSSTVKMSQMIEAMNNISKATAEISKINKVINDIAFQTNLLALNASVEAARAGDAGKGFAVVAGEVRNLAKNSADAAAEADRLIGISNSAVEGGNKIAVEAAESIGAIIGSIKDAAHLLESIAQASLEQERNIDQMSSSSEEISAVVAANMDAANDAAANSQQLSAQAAMLRDAVEHFTLRDTQSTKNYRISQK